MTDAPNPQKLEKLSRFEGLSTEDLKTITKAGTEVHQPAGWALISEATPADKAYLILDGTVSIRQHGNEIAQLGPGDIIGEMAIVDHKLRNASVISLTPLDVIHFTRAAIEQLANDVPSFGEALRETSEDRRPPEA
jgi:CRP-like cAMP-binding protein